MGGLVWLIISVSEHLSGSANDLSDINSLGVKDDRVAVNIFIIHSL